MFVFVHFGCVWHNVRNVMCFPSYFRVVSDFLHLLSSFFCGKCFENSVQKFLP